MRTAVLDRIQFLAYRLDHYTLTAELRARIWRELKKLIADLNRIDENAET